MSYTDVLLRKMREDQTAFAVFEPLNDIVRFRGGHAYSRICDSVRRVLGPKTNFHGVDEYAADELALAVFGGRVDIRSNESMDGYVRNLGK